VSLLDVPQVVGADLMAQSSTAAVDEDDDLTLRQSVRLRHVVPKHVRHTLDFEKVVAAAETAQLILPAIFRLRRDGRRVTLFPNTLVFAVCEVGVRRVAFF
jgi:hypothetical protein